MSKVQIAPKSSLICQWFLWWILIIGWRVFFFCLFLVFCLFQDMVFLYCLGTWPGTLQTILALNSQRSTSLYLLSAGIKGVCYHQPAWRVSLRKQNSLKTKTLRLLKSTSARMKPFFLFFLNHPLLCVETRIFQNPLWPGIGGKPGLQSECQDRLQSYTEKPCLKKQNKTKKSSVNESHLCLLG